MERQCSYNRAPQPQPYALSQEPLTLAAVAAALGELGCRFDVSVVAECDSTNARLLALAESGAPSGSVFVALHQSAGRGRRGRPWLSAPGDSLTFSVLWRFPTDTSIAGLSLAVGVGLARAFERLKVSGVALKWPNDVLAGDAQKKLAGVLIELVPGSSFSAVIGIGTNLRLPPQMPAELRERATALSDCAIALPPISEILAEILTELHAVLSGFARAGFLAWKSEWLKRNAHAGREVRVLSEFSDPIVGQCRGVDDDGALLLDTAAGAQRIVSGDVSLRTEVAQNYLHGVETQGRRVLCLDCGNTRLKWAVHQGGAWLCFGALPLTAIDSLPNVLEALVVSTQLPDSAICCNVAGEATAAAIAATVRTLSIPLVWVNSLGEQCGIKNGYDDPTQLGADRWAALIGARARHGGSCLVVCAGTATTIDRLDADGRFRGGLILPGIALMCASLAHATAQLPLGGGSLQSLPTNTADAITSGCILATAGAVGRMFADIAAEGRAVCLLSGGAAEVLRPALDIPCRRIDNLVLEGLARISMTLGETSRPIRR